MVDPAHGPLAVLTLELERLAPAGCLGVAVSGGGDSMALLALTLLWSQRTGRDIRAVSVDHGLRPAAADEARAVAEFCQEENIPHAILRADLHQVRGNVPAEAREARYRLMANWAQSYDVTAVLVGHTMDDQAETVLMRLARGAGVDGLSAMQPCRTWMDMIWLRPLLGVRRETLRAWLRQQGIDWAEDPTNQDPRFDRVKIRRALAALEPMGIEVPELAETANRLQQQRDVLDAALSKLAHQALHWGELGEAWLQADALANALPELQRRLLARVLMRVSGQSYAPRHRSMAPLLEQAWYPGFRGTTLGGCLVKPLQGKILICREPAAAAGPIGDWTGKALWDDRWHLLGPPGRDFRISALGADGASRLKEAEATGWEPPANWKSAPYEVRLTLPAVWRLTPDQAPTLAAVPSIAYLNGSESSESADWHAELILRHDDRFSS